MKHVWLLTVVCFCVVSGTPQYADFYSSLDAFLARGSLSADPIATSAQPATPDRRSEPIVPNQSIGSSDGSNPNQSSKDPFYMTNIHTWDSIPAAFIATETKTATPKPSSPPTNVHNLKPTQSSNSQFDLMDVNTWDTIPSLFFAVPSSQPQTQPPVTQKNSYNDHSNYDPAPSRTSWQYSTYGMDHGIGSGGVDSGNMVGGGSPGGGPQETFLPLADHSPGSVMADNPGQMLDWSSPPVSKDTHKYDDLPIQHAPPPADAEAMAKAVLRGQVKRWEWTYSSTLLNGEMSSRYKDDAQSSVFCCQRLPYICNVDGVCVIERDECQSFCSCANNPNTPHCTKDVIPRIKKRMTSLENKILQRVSVELNLPPPPPLETTPAPIGAIQSEDAYMGLSTYMPMNYNRSLTFAKISVTPTTPTEKYVPKSTSSSKYYMAEKRLWQSSNIPNPIIKATTAPTPIPIHSKSNNALQTQTSSMKAKSTLQSSVTPLTLPVRKDSKPSRVIHLSARASLNGLSFPSIQTSSTPSPKSTFASSTQKPRSTTTAPKHDHDALFNHMMGLETPFPAGSTLFQPTSFSPTTSIYHSVTQQVNGEHRDDTNPFSLMYKSGSDSLGSSSQRQMVQTPSSRDSLNTTLSLSQDKKSGSEMILGDAMKYASFNNTNISVSTVAPQTTTDTTTNFILPSSHVDGLTMESSGGSGDTEFNQHLIFNNIEQKELYAISNTSTTYTTTISRTDTTVTTTDTTIISPTKTTMSTTDTSTISKTETTMATTDTTMTTKDATTISTTDATMATTDTTTKSTTDTTIATTDATTISTTDTTMATTTKSTIYTTDATTTYTKDTNVATTDATIATTDTSTISTADTSISSTDTTSTTISTANTTQTSETPSVNLAGTTNTSSQPTYENSKRSSTNASSFSETDSGSLSPTTPPNESDLVDLEREQGFLDWLRSNTSVLRETSSADPHSASATLSLDELDGGDLCSSDCEKKGGKCLMGSDFKPYCEFGDGDPCDHFQCINGLCSPTDRLYVCDCSEGWTGTFCEQPCNLDCGEHGSCGRVGNNMTGCICHANYTGHRCEEKRKFAPGLTGVSVNVNTLKVWEVAIIAIMAAVCMAAVFVVLPYILWRHQWLPIRQLVFYFQEYEDDDDKDYDAFVSYKSTPRDERFILQHLYPKLEKELDFRLCLHFRDFSPGEPNNIINAIERSRRTIMILSPSYVASEWCRMEYQKAQHEMLRLKHKIIPIILEDISDMPEMDSNLKTIINTVTYIDWPGEEEPSTSKKVERFWKLLELSMPKKKDALARSLSSCSSDLPLTNITKSCFDSIASSLKGDDGLSAMSLSSTSSAESGVSSTDSEKCLEQEFSSGESHVKEEKTKSERKSSQGSSNAGSTAITGNKTASSVEESSVCKSRRSSDSEKTQISATSALSSRTKQLPFEHVMTAPMASGKLRKTTDCPPPPAFSLTENDLLSRCPTIAAKNEVLPSTNPLTCPIPGEKTIPEASAPAKKISSDDFIIEVREVGNQIRIAARPQRKYSELLV